MILIIDYGSQYTHLIKRNCRDLGKEAMIVNSKTGYKEIDIKSTERIIISGGPSSVYAKELGIGKQILENVKSGKLAMPVLGICFGHQLIAHVFGGKVEKGKSAGYGISKVVIFDNDDLFKGIPNEIKTWVSHFDEVRELPPDFIVLAGSESCKVEAMKSTSMVVYGVQFHPEVWHTEYGDRILGNFINL